MAAFDTFDAFLVVIAGVISFALLLRTAYRKSKTTPQAKREIFLAGFLIGLSAAWLILSTAPWKRLAIGAVYGTIIGLLMIKGVPIQLDTNRNRKKHEK